MTTDDLRADIERVRPMIWPCELPGCWQLVTQPSGAGRPRRFCCDEHRRDADVMRKRTVARINRMRELIRRDEHLLAALEATTTDHPAHDDTNEGDDHAH